MLGNFIKSLIFILILSFCFSCMAGEDDINKTKESIMAFEINDVAYPIRFANYQRNSCVTLPMKSKWKPLWSKLYAEINEDMRVLPYTLLIKDDYVGVRSKNEMIIYDTAGNLKYQTPLSWSAGVIFGKSALAYMLPSQQLMGQDYEFNQLGHVRTIPEMTEWAYELLLIPTLDDVRAVVQFTGGPKGPKRKPTKYFLYRYLREERQVDWYFEFDGIVNSALLTNDEKTIVLIKPNEVALFNADDGKSKSSFEIDLEFVPDSPAIASLDINDNLLIQAKRIKDEKTQQLLIAYSLDGKELWSFPLNEPNDLQPPACDNDGRIFIIDGLQLLCIKDGEIDWTAILKPAERNYLTITADNFAVVLNGNLLALFDPKGEKIFERLITKTDDQFYAPPALDKEGHIFVAGQKALYCFE